MLEIYFIRHSMTEGNRQQRYIGKGTDEPLCEEGFHLLEGIEVPVVEAVFVSSMKRCVQTANFIYPEFSLITVDELMECDFGDFENKSFKELSGNLDYQTWVDSNGSLPFPNGESRQEFADRSRRGFRRVLEYCKKKKLNTAAVVVHGGTIMSIMEAYAFPRKGYFEWQVKNARGFHVVVQEASIDIENPVLHVR